MNFNLLFSNIRKDVISERKSNKSVSMIMRITFLFLCLCACFAYGQSESNDISKNDNKNRIPIDSLIDISINIEEVVWQDSTKVVFLALTHHDDKYDLKHSNLGITKKYRNLGGPIVIGNRFADTCLIHPILTKGNTSFFLLDDFINLNDSLIALSISVAVGEYDKNQEFTFFEFPTIELGEVITIINSITANPNSLLGTKKWYEKWVQNNPDYTDERIRNFEKQCGQIKLFKAAVGMPVSGFVNQAPDYYVYHDSKDTLFLTKIDVGYSSITNKSTTVVDSIQIDGLGAKEVIFERHYEGEINDIKQAEQTEESRKIHKNEIWNIDTKVLLFEAISDYEFHYDNWNIHNGSTKGICFYHYDFNIDSTGQIRIHNLIELKTGNECRADKSTGIYKYENNGYRFYHENELIKERTQNDSLSWQDYDSIKQVSDYSPVDTYFYVWKEGKCGLVVNQKLVIPINYTKDDFIFGDGLIAITAHGEPLTLIDPIDSVVYHVTTNTGDLLNDDSLHTAIQVYNLNDGSSYIEVLREYYNIRTANGLFPDSTNHSWNTSNEIYIINKNTGKTTAIYTDTNCAYIPGSGIVISLTPKNKKKKIYDIQIYSTFTAKALYSYTWRYNVEYSMRESEVYQDQYCYKLWYFDPKKAKEILIGYLKWDGEYFFYKKVK